MNAEFVQEVIEHEHVTWFGRFTGWETVIFQLEDEPESDLSTAALAP